MADLALERTPRLRPSPFLERALAAGAKGASVYNHMILPSRFAGTLEEYRALVENVAIWDVGCQRQVEIRGPDALALVQYLCTRDVSRVGVGRARYTFLCNHRGGVVNDPVLLRVAEDRFWLSLADRDVLLWAQAVAAERGFTAEVCEPDVSPLQIQGPKSRALATDLFGAEIANLGYYRAAWTRLDGMELLVSRTGWSGEFGYEVFLTEAAEGGRLWDRVFAAGEPYGAQPASPNQIRRMEGGILSYGTDMNDSVNPYELGFGRLVEFPPGTDFIGRAALEELAERPPRRLLTGARMDGPPITAFPEHRPVTAKGRRVGVLTSACFSPRLATNLGYVFVESPCAQPETRLQTEVDGLPRTAVAHPLPFITPVKS